MQRGLNLARRLLSAPRRLPDPVARSLRSAAGPHRTHRDECSAYKLQGRIPSTYDKKVLLWTGRFKREQDIPEIVSIEMLYAARNKIRVQVCYLMIAMSIVACVVMVVSGKKAFKQHESLTKWNLEKKAKLKEQYVQEHGIVTEKAQ
ncbi:protein FAM162A-like [Pristis pectinata]|uniref:protein FAM162A-like n=1 Tax=Pristis pectinata TaxID=685728 RepID=UPI00223D8452|nr:protein FAM162A-like [Pristis pectinata]